MLTDPKQEVEPKREGDIPIKSPEESIHQSSSHRSAIPPPLQNLAGPSYKPNAPNIIQYHDEEDLATFGWEQIEKGPLIPYIVRGCAKFVACHIIVEKIFKVIMRLFSNKMINCIEVMRHLMNNSEAKAFNEININHCDKGLVGTYVFKPGDLMVDIDSVKKFVNYYYACRNVTLLGEIYNNLFGFLRIADQNEVPFVWNDSQKLVPLLYFEGKSDYVDLKSKVLEDYWQIGYLKFCFMVQKVRPQLYTENPIRVIDIKDVEILFPPNTTFEICRPKEVNEVIFMPSVKLPIAKANGPEKRPACGDEDNHSKRPKINESQAQKALTVQPANPTRNFPNYKLVSPKQYESRIQQNRPQQLQKFIPSQKAFSNQSTVQNQDCYTRQNNFEFINQLAQLAGKSYSQPIETFGSAHEMPNQYSTINRRPQSYYSNRPTETHQMSNVPSISPAVASSPGIRQASPVMTEAVIERYPQGNSLLGKEYQNIAQQQMQSTQFISPYTNQFWQPSKGPGTYKAVQNPTAEYQTKETTVALPGPSATAKIKPYALNDPNLSSSHTVYQNLQQLEVNYKQRNTQQVCQNSCTSCGSTNYLPPNTIYQPYANHYSLGYASSSKPPNLISNISGEPNSKVLFPGVNVQNSIPTQNKEFIDISHIADTGWCVTKNCPLNKISLLGIKKSWNSNEWLVNFSELAEKTLSVNSDKNQDKLTSLFKTFYSLRAPIQIIKWNKALKESKITLGQRYKDTFVDYSETKLIMTNLSSKIFNVYAKTRR